VASVTIEQRIEQLTTVLGELKRLHDELWLVVRNKLEAMRKADTDAIRSATAREEFLIRRMREQDGLRKQLLELIGKLVNIPAPQARRMAVSEVADYAKEPVKSQLLALAAALRDRVKETAEGNRVAAVVSHEMLKHFRQVYDVMAQVDQGPAVYSRTGQAERRTGTSVFDAVV
jgi:hypothetical protein